MQFIITVYGLPEDEERSAKVSGIGSEIKDDIQNILPTTRSSGPPTPEILFIFIPSTVRSAVREGKILVRVEQIGGGMKWYPEKIRECVSKRFAYALSRTVVLI